jgi:hypothetical protein
MRKDKSPCWESSMGFFCDDLSCFKWQSKTEQKKFNLQLWFPPTRQQFQKIETVQDHRKDYS